MCAAARGGSADAASGTGEPPERSFAGLPRNVLLLGLVSFFNDLGSEMIFPVLPLFLVGGLGASMAVVGLIDGIAESTAALVRVYSGALSDRFRRRRPLVLGGYGLSNAAQPLMALATHWSLVLPLRFAERLGKGIRSAPRDAIIADAVCERNRGWAYGFHRAMDSAGGVLGPIVAFVVLAGLALSRGAEPLAQLGSGMETPAADYRWVILAAAIPNAVAVGLILLVRERSRCSPEPPPTLRPAPPAGPFRILLAAVGVFGLGNISYSFIVLRAGELGVSVLLLPLLYLFFHLGQTVFSGPLGALSDRIGRKPIVAAGYATFALMCAGWALADSPWHAGALSGVAGITALPAGLIAGLLWSAYGAAAAFTWGGVLAALGTGLLLLVRPAKAPTAPA